ncbi:MAG: decarboxylating NADP(+)-dependent phosphogluconate dehydrogenase [Spirochaetes bacterium]|nr:decarboxylating NADP(+)-dependent phosphogluconate dehydrogenase [Spirochaetota bacterium]
MSKKGDIAVIGLAVMGQNLILNMNDHGVTVVAYNRTTSKVDDFVNGAAKGTNIIGVHSLEEMIDKLIKPRKIMLMVKAGEVVDHFIKSLLPHLEPGDIIIDGGNSNYTDTQRRIDELAESGILYIGSGISGGEEGARHGPSIMPGGNPKAWPSIKDIFKKISAKTEDKQSCCEWIGTGGSGHFVKMVHNGIEYGDMQLICEAYHLMKEYLGLSASQIQQVFTQWNETELDSYLIEITSQIFTKNDTDGQPLVEKILDTAGQKGTGKWTGINALNLGIPLTLISEAVFARALSAKKEERTQAAKIIKKPEVLKINDFSFTEDIRKALLASKIVSYAQGFMLMKEASHEFHWDLNYGNIALIWRAGCIIRSKFLGKIKTAYDKNPELDNLLLDDYFKDILLDCLSSWRKVTARAIENGIPVPCMSSAIAFFDGYSSENLPANLLQAQRDYFGAHTYERKDKPRGEFFHTDWTGQGGDVSSTTYNA